MHEHDPDLIMSLAEGTLPAGEATAAEAAIAGCRQCSTDLDAQRSVIAALRTLPAPALMDSERRQLRHRLETALHLDREPAAAPVRRRRRWYASPVFAGAAVATLIAVVVVPAALRSRSNDTADIAAIAGADEAAETTVAARQPGGEALVDEDLLDFRSAEPGSARSETPAAVEAAPTTTLLGDGVMAETPAADDTAAGEGESSPTDGFGYLPIDEQGLVELRSILIAGEPDAAAAVTQFRLIAPETGPVPADVVRECLSVGRSSIGTDGVPYAVAGGDYEGEPAVLVAYPGATPADVILAVHSQTDCAILATAGP